MHNIKINVYFYIPHNILYNIRNIFRNYRRFTFRILIAARLLISYTYLHMTNIPIVYRIVFSTKRTDLSPRYSVIRIQQLMEMSISIALSPRIEEAAIFHHSMSRNIEKLLTLSRTLWIILSTLFPISCIFTCAPNIAPSLELCSKRTFNDSRSPSHVIARASSSILLSLSRVSRALRFFRNLFEGTHDLLQDANLFREKNSLSRLALYIFCFPRVLYSALADIRPPGLSLLRQLSSSIRLSLSRRSGGASTLRYSSEWAVTVSDSG